MAFSPATWYRPYVSKAVRDAAGSTWVQIDLGSPRTIEAIRLYPAFNLGQKHMAGYGFPVRFKLEGSDDPSFAKPRPIVDRTAADCANPDDQIVQYVAKSGPARFVRLTATRLRPAPNGIGYSLALSKIEVISGGKDVAEHCAVTGDANYANGTDLSQLTRPPRPMGEGIVTDNPGNVIPSNRWKAIPYRANAPLSGVTVEGETFRRAMENNAGYLLGSFSVEEMLRPFRERAGKPVRAGLRPPIAFWDTELPGSSAGRFLMGAGNTLRWMDHAELRRWMNELVDGIEECRAANGYIMAYPEDTILLFRARRLHPRMAHPWADRGGIRGQRQSLRLTARLLRLVRQLPVPAKAASRRGAGVQGMIGNTRMYFTPAGKPEDIQVDPALLPGKLLARGLAQREHRMSSGSIPTTVRITT